MRDGEQHHQHSAHFIVNLPIAVGATRCTHVVVFRFFIAFIRLYLEKFIIDLMCKIRLPCVPVPELLLMLCTPFV